MAEPGPRNLITDVSGILVGQAEDSDGITGTTVVLAEAPAGVRGGIGSAWLRLGDGETVGALVAVNSWASVVRPDCGRLWAAELALAGEIMPQPALPAMPPDPEDFSACAAAAAGAN